MIKILMYLYDKRFCSLSFVFNVFQYFATLHGKETNQMTAMQKMETHLVHFGTHST